MFERRVKIGIGISLLAIGVLQATLGFYSDNLPLFGIGVVLVVLNVAYVYVAARHADE